MVLYQQIVYAVPKLPSSVLAIMFRRHAETVIANGGVVRMVENQGLRPLQARATKYVEN